MDSFSKAFSFPNPDNIDSDKSSRIAKIYSSVYGMYIFWKSKTYKLLIKHELIMVAD